MRQRIWAAQIVVAPLRMSWPEARCHYGLPKRRRSQQHLNVVYEWGTGAIQGRVGDPQLQQQVSWGAAEVTCNSVAR